MSVDGDGPKGSNLFTRQEAVALKAVLVECEMNRSRWRRSAAKDWVDRTEVQGAALAEKIVPSDGAGVKIQNQIAGVVARE